MITFEHLGEGPKPIPVPPYFEYQNKLQSQRGNVKASGASKTKKPLPPPT